MKKILFYIDNKNCEAISPLIDRISNSWGYDSFQISRAILIIATINFYLHIIYSISDIPLQLISFLLFSYLHILDEKKIKEFQQELKRVQDSGQLTMKMVILYESFVFGRMVDFIVATLFILISIIWGNFFFVIAMLLRSVYKYAITVINLGKKDKAHDKIVESIRSLSLKTSSARI